MRTAEIIEEIERLPVLQRMYILEKTIRSIRTEEDKEIMRKAADLLLEDYKKDAELTSFTCLDMADFYETR
jgi:hypothetical protein